MPIVRTENRTTRSTTQLTIINQSTAVQIGGSASAAVVARCDHDCRVRPASVS